MATHLSILLVVCAVLVALGGATSLERSPLKPIPSDKERVLFRITRTEDDHAHEEEEEHTHEEEEEDSHAHNEEGAGQECLTECVIAHEFSELAEERKFGGSKLTCDIEPEHCHHGNGTEEDHGHDNDHHDNDHHDDGDHHDDDDDHHEHNGDHHNESSEAGSGMELCSGYPTCLETYQFFLELMKRLNFTSDCCLVNGTRCGEGGTEGRGGTGLTDPAKAYGYGFLMAIGVASASVFGVLIVPLLQKNSKIGRYYKYFKALMIALGASALFCDAILHLIPHAFNLHAHDEEEGGAHDHEEEGVADFIWKGCIVILGVYGFFLLEVVLHIWNAHTHGHAHGHAHGPTLLSDDEESSSSGNESSDMLKKQRKTSETAHSDMTPHGVVCQETPIDVSEFTNRADGDVVPNKGTGEEPMVNNKEKEEEKRNRNKNGSEKKEGCLKRVYHFFTNIKPLAWLIILGDSVHKLADGLAIGAAVSQSLSLGLSTAIAVLFHEIPHEFGDFAILLSTGMKWYTALFFNFLSSLTTILGFFVGVALGTGSTETTNWILAIAAGVFLYIALVDLLPELIHSNEKGCTRWILFLMANIGFYISFVVLLLIAIYEEQLNTLVK